MFKSAHLQLFSYQKNKMKNNLKEVHNFCKKGATVCTRIRYNNISMVIS